VVNQLELLAAECKAEISIQDFTHVGVEDCIHRDSLRNGGEFVGETVIRNMWEQFLKPKDSVPTGPANPPKYDPGLPFAIICDMDGTLALRGDRTWFEWSKVGQDTLNLPVARVLDVFKHATGNLTIITSGRKEQCRAETLDWLRRHGIEVHELIMRRDDDNRKDAIVKREMYDLYIHEKYNIRFVLDDRDQVVKMWRDLGLPTFQVNYGNF
jgi:hypothetical protein